MEYGIKCIGLLTSGGDAPGMNAAIRSVTRAAIFNGIRVKAIYRGYKGLITGEIVEFQTQNVSNIIQQGGTILKSARCQEFRTKEGRQLAYENMKKEGIDALVVIGGDGTFTGARIFAQEFNVPIIGLPGTIDNDLYGTDSTIGYDTAMNTIVDAVDKIRDTATSHERLFFIEVMGRDAGFLALNSALASGAEAAIIPERETKVDQLEELVKNGFRKSKNSSIVIVAESEVTGGANGLAERMHNEHPEYDVRVTILGHIQRGGSPTAVDRILASRMGEAAIEAIEEFPHGFTASGHPVGCAIALKAIDVVMNEGLADNVNRLAPRFEDGLKRLAEKANIGEYRGVGFMWALEAVRDKATKTPFEGNLSVSERIANTCTDLGLICRPLGQSVVLCPPFILTEGQMDEMFEKLEKALDTVFAEVA